MKDSPEMSLSRPDVNKLDRLAVGVPLGQVVPRRVDPVAEMVMLADPRSVAAERFRRLKTILDQKEAPQVVVVCSAIPGEGKSFVAANLGLAYAADTKGETLLVDADLRQPSLGRWITPEPNIGMSHVLTGQAELEHGLVTLKNTPLRVLTAGQAVPDPLELLGSKWARVLSTLRGRFHRIVIDTPAAMLFADAEVLSATSDGVLLVTRSEVTPEAVYRKGLASLASSRVLGVVLNDIRPNLADRQRVEESYYDHYRRERT
jgi:capsular exopolysaccharide synthesis family protein